MNQEEALQGFQPQLLLTKTKKELKADAGLMVKKSLENGFQNPLHLYVQAHKIAQFFGEVASEAHGEAMKEALKHGKSHTQYDTKIEVKDVGVSYDYSNCNDDKLNALLEDKKLLDEAIRDRQKFLQTLKSPLSVLDEDSGEVNVIHPAVRKSSEKVTLTY